jgi:hypothetical protein
MKVLKRAQVTQIHIERMVTHDLAVDGKTYTRYETISVGVPYMDMDITVQQPRIRWVEFVGDRSIKDLTKKEVKELNLEEQFRALDINDRNGNGK